jgi:nucleoside phosphorylase
VAGRPAVLTDDGALCVPEDLRKRTEGDPFFPYKDPVGATAHVLIMGTGPAVRSDQPFPKLQEIERKVGAIDMEAASFYHTANQDRELARSCLVVKGVSDNADSEKDDSYHEYASKAAAIYIFHFVREFVNSRLMPRLGARDSTVGPV